MFSDVLLCFEPFKLVRVVLKPATYFNQEENYVIVEKVNKSRPNQNCFPKFQAGAVFCFISEIGILILRLLGDPTNGLTVLDR